MYCVAPINSKFFHNFALKQRPPSTLFKQLHYYCDSQSWDKTLPKCLLTQDLEAEFKEAAFKTAFTMACKNREQSTPLHKSRCQPSVSFRLFSEHGQEDASPYPWLSKSSEANPSSQKRVDTATKCFVQDTLGPTD